MRARPMIARPRVVRTIIAAGLAVLITTSLFAAITSMFQREGAPFEQVVAAERACANYAFISERETCVRLDLAASRVHNIASR